MRDSNVHHSVYVFEILDHRRGLPETAGMNMITWVCCFSQVRQCHVAKGSRVRGVGIGDAPRQGRPQPHRHVHHMERGRCWRCFRSHSRQSASPLIPLAQPTGRSPRHCAGNSDPASLRCVRCGLEPVQMEHGGVCSSKLRRTGRRTPRCIRPPDGSRAHPRVLKHAPAPPEAQASM